MQRYNVKNMYCVEKKWIDLPQTKQSKPKRVQCVSEKVDTEISTQMSIPIKLLNLNVERKVHTCKQKSQNHKWWKIQAWLRLSYRNIQSQTKGIRVCVWRKNLGEQRWLTKLKSFLRWWLESERCLQPSCVQVSVVNWGEFGEGWILRALASLMD